MKAAIYARFSSTLQDGRSIDDQVRICRERAEREGYEVVGVFPDYAISGAVRDRPGLNALMESADKFTVVIAEALDRISRDQEDIANIFKRLTFAGVKLLTLSEGEVTEMHIGFKGTMNAMFLTGLAEKIRRGQRGRVEAGRIPGGLCYGYRKVLKMDAKGEPERGLREIDDDQAEIVRRCYAEALAGASGRDIAKALNNEGIPAPRGGQWLVSMILGDKVRGNGILRNPIYCGRLVHNRTQMVRDPSTRRRIPRVRPKIDWVEHAVPELAIVTISEFEQVQALFKATAGWTFTAHRRPRRLLSGLVKCGLCGGNYVITDRDLWACGTAKKAGTCNNHRKIRTTALETRVLAGLQEQLLDADAVSDFVREYHRHSATVDADNRRTRIKTERLLKAVTAKVDKYVIAIGDGAKNIPEVIDALQRLRIERDGLQKDLAEMEAHKVVMLHPAIAAQYRRQVDSLTTAIADDPDARIKAIPAIRSLVDNVTVTPMDEPRGVHLDVTGRLASIIALATGAPLQTTAIPMRGIVGSGGGT